MIQENQYCFDCSKTAGNSKNKKKVEITDKKIYFFNLASNNFGLNNSLFKWKFLGNILKFKLLL